MDYITSNQLTAVTVPGASKLTQAWSTANVTYDALGRVNAYSIGNYFVTNITYGNTQPYLGITTVGNVTILTGSANVYGNVIVSYRERVGTTTQNVTINYSGNTIANIVIS